MPPGVGPSQNSSSIAIQLIKKCTTTTSLGEARRVHAVLLTSPFILTESPLFICNNVISMYARCRSIANAQVIFDMMPHRNVVSYNSLMSAYSRIPGHAYLAFRLFRELGNEYLSPNGFTMTSILQASAELGDIVIGSSVHAQCVKNGFWGNVHVQTSLVGMYSNCQDTGLAMKVFRSMIDKDDLAWNSIISGYVKNGKLSETLVLLQKMMRDGMNPTRFTYSLVLNACAKLEDFDSGKHVHAQVLVSGTQRDLPLHNSLLDMYCSCCDPNTALNVFWGIKNPDLVSWNSIICGFSQCGDGGMAMKMFLQLRQLSPLEPDEYTLAAVVSGTSGFPACYYGKPLHAQSIKSGLECNLYVANMLLSMYFNNDDSVSSQKIFASLMHKDLVLWTDMIACHVRLGKSEDALNFFNEMLKEGFRPDTFTLSSALSACADSTTLRQGEMIHCFAVKTGNEIEVCVCSSVIDMYAKNGEIKAAAYAFSHLPDCDLMCWNSMLTGYGHHGKVKEAFQIFFKMLRHGLTPDLVTFLSLLAACSHCGLVNESRYFWNCMKENGLRPGPKHYSCIISSLSRAGLWEEAEKMILESPFVDDYIESWRTILNSCILDGNLGVGIHAAEQIMSADVEDNAATVLLAKLYGAAGRWDDVSEMRRKMRKLTQEKDPGLSSIEVQNHVHSFSAGDQSHPQNSEILAELSKLLGNLVPPMGSKDITYILSSVQ